MSEKSIIYFVSDLHLGLESSDKDREREKFVVDWLNVVRKDAKEIWFLGDVFDYWFEYKRVVPRGFTRFLGKLSELSDEGIEIHYFTGNHDIWVFDYLPTEIGLTLHRDPIVREIYGHKFFLGHGDGYSPKDYGYLFIKKIFNYRFLQWCYARIHPNAATTFARWSARKSRESHDVLAYRGADKEDIVRFSRGYAEKDPSIEFYIFGHRHRAFEVTIENKARVICLGDWIKNFTYARFDRKELKLEKFFQDRGEIIIDKV